jgi:hypothetical protein
LVIIVFIFAPNDGYAGILRLYPSFEKEGISLISPNAINRFYFMYMDITIITILIIIFLRNLYIVLNTFKLLLEK